MEPKLITDLQQWFSLRSSLKAGSIGFVPTMGALHEGHVSLLRRARAENQTVVLSIYMNPTQFDNQDDLKRYPATLDHDRKLAGDADFILLPTYEQLYPDNYRYRVSETEFSKKLCGAHRPGHFDGVLTVVMKLLNIVGADRAYFGEKDFQQLELVRGMTKAFFLPTQIVPCPTVREQDGLALSSRNLNLPAQARAKAPALYQALRRAPTADEARAELTNQGFAVDYVEDIGGRRFAAAKLGGVRLIDNVER